MSQEQLLKTLNDLGLTNVDSQIYVFLAKKGTQKAIDAARQLKLNKQQIYRSLTNLQSMGLVSSTFERPSRFTAVTFDKVLDLFVKTKMEEAQQIRKNKDELLSIWKSIQVGEVEPSAKFMVLEGRNVIYSKILQMVQDTRNQLSSISTLQGIARAEQYGLFDAVFSHPLKSNIRFRFLTELSEQTANTITSFLKKIPRQGFNIEIRAPDLGLKLLSRMVIRDCEEAIFFISPSTNHSAVDNDDVGLWTNCGSLVQSFDNILEDFWLNATDIQKKISEIESGKQSPKTFVIKEAEAAFKRYDETTRKAEKSIFMITSQSGLVNFNNNENKVTEWVQKGVSIKIMAPVTSENLEAAYALSKTCAVKHVPADYLGTTIVDGQHLFQFKNSPPNQADPESIEYFENTFYTNDGEYIRRTENMLNDIWINAQIPSAIALKAVIQKPQPLNKPSNANILGDYTNELKRIVGFSYRMEPQEGKITEEEVLNKIANAKRIPAKDSERDILRIYGTQGVAVIYPPKNLNLPNFIILVSHNNSQSSFGAGNTIFFYMQMKIADHESYLPAAFVTDNPQGHKFRKSQLKSQHNTEVAHLVKKDQLKVQAHGDRLFAGWTVPIPILPPKYILPPACILFEGYGKIKSYTSEVIGPLNRKINYEYNNLEAFVTFLHPSSNYHGPGSDALLHREIIMTSYPPSAWKKEV